jgi:hypothetical protein
MPALWIPAAFGILTTLLLNTRVLPYGPQTLANVRVAATGAAFVLLVTLLVFLAGRQVRWAIVALVIVTAVDLGVWGITYIYREPPRPIEELIQGIPQAPTNPGDAYAVAPSHDTSPNILVMRGYRLTTGYVGLFPESFHSLWGDTAARLSGAKWRFTPDGVRHPIEGGVERVRLLDEQGNAAAGAASMAIDRPGRLAIDVDAPGRRVVALTERFHDGWVATAGNVRVATVRVEHDFLGCVVDGGVQHINLRFMPRSFVYGSILSAIGIVLLAGVMIVGVK